MECKTKIVHENMQKTTKKPATDHKPHARTIYKIPLLLLLIVPLLILLLGYDSGSGSSGLLSPRHATAFANSLVKYAVAAAPALLQVFQVYPPVLTPTENGVKLTNDSADGHSLVVQQSGTGCVVTQRLMKHSFANSYNNPFVAEYMPPKNCEFNRITFNLTVISAGRQFDRLGIVYFGSTEIWRLSTAEPTADGIEFGYIKDMSNYLTLFKKPQKLIFDLGNLIDSTYTAPYNATLDATFFTSDDTVDPAHRIYSLSANLGSKSMPSVIQYPQMEASDAITIPQNTRRAVFTVAATGQIDEEFWFGDVLTSEVDTFGKGVLLPYSPFREVHLLIDGLLVGVVWPFPIIFSGGVVPGLWRPIVGIDTFDLREDEIDITPWLGFLCDGNPHTFELTVNGINDDGEGNGHLTPNIGSYWLLTGKIFIWLDAAGSVTTGSAISHNSPPPAIQLSSQITKTADGKKNKTLTYTVGVSRHLRTSSTIKTATETFNAIWSQDLNFTNHGIVTNHGNTQYIKMLTTGSDQSSTGYSRMIEYPIRVNTTFAVNPETKAFTIHARLRRGQSIFVSGRPVFPTGLQSFNPIRSSRGEKALQSSMLQTTQNGTAHYFANAKNTVARSSGNTQQDMTFVGFHYADRAGAGMMPSSDASDGSTELYHRHVLAKNGTVVEDHERLFGKPFGGFSIPESRVGGAQEGFAGGSIRRLLGRGPGPP